MPPVQRACQRLAASAAFERSFLGLIFLNAIVLGAETYHQVDRRYGDTLHTLNDVLLGLFCVELAIRIAAYGRRPQDFFRSGWNVFDFVVIGAGFAPGLRENATLLRVVRLLRIVRAIRLLPDLRIIVVAIGRSIPGIGSLAAMTLLLVYVYGMLGWVVFHDHDPGNFSSIGQAMLTMFVLLTLENLPTYIEKGMALSDWTVLFYISYVLIASFLIFNLFIGIVINSMEEARAIELRRTELELLDEDPVNDAAAHRRLMADRLRKLRAAVDDLEAELGAAGHTGRAP
jgi:voltage-gated sodium channel